MNFQDVALGGDELPKGPSQEKRKDLMIDSAISRSHYPEERELERWAPDEGDSECIELEKYDRKGNRYGYKVKIYKSHQWKLDLN